MATASPPRSTSVEMQSTRSFVSKDAAHLVIAAAHSSSRTPAVSAALSTEQVSSGGPLSARRKAVSAAAFATAPTSAPTAAPTTWSSSGTDAFADCGAMRRSTISDLAEMPGSASKAAKSLSSKPSPCFLLSAASISGRMSFPSFSNASFRIFTKLGSPETRWTWCAIDTKAARDGASGPVRASFSIISRAAMSLRFASMTAKTAEISWDPGRDNMLRASCA
mmetsp:Transcript_92732/g.261864  ORF Transcript_92732/g.261864 Transcript_92732/m.261864 type:complete len:222 (+) Transcript_92732:562-1227(+)